MNLFFVVVSRTANALLSLDSDTPRGPSFPSPAGAPPPLPQDDFWASREPPWAVAPNPSYHWPGLQVHQTKPPPPPGFALPTCYTLNMQLCLNRNFQGWNANIFPTHWIKRIVFFLNRMKESSALPPRGGSPPLPPLPPISYPAPGCVPVARRTSGTASPTHGGWCMGSLPRGHCLAAWACL